MTTRWHRQAWWHERDDPNGWERPRGGWDIDEPRRQVRRELADDLDAHAARPVPEYEPEMVEDDDPPIDSHWDREREDREAR